MHFEKDYSTTAWIHSLIDSTTMLCGMTGVYSTVWCTCINTSDPNNLCFQLLWAVFLGTSYPAEPR